MADTRVQLEVENWVRQEWMPGKYGRRFAKANVALTSGGVFEFDAVSEDGAIVASISTSAASTSGGKLGVGKLMKMRSDMLFLTLADVSQRVMLFTEPDMYAQCVKEREAGRTPREIELEPVQIPNELRSELEQARRSASEEVQPRRRT